MICTQSLPLGFVSMLWHGSVHIGGNSGGFAMHWVLQAYVVLLNGTLSIRQLFSGRVGGDVVLMAMLFVYVDFMGSTRAAASGLGLLHRRCDNCSTQLSGDCLVPSPGLTVGVSDATAFLCGGGSTDLLGFWRSSSSRLCSSLPALSSLDTTVSCTSTSN